MPEYGKQEKPQGGDNLNEEQVKNIVMQVLAGQQEKTQLSREMGELRKGIKDANEGLAGLKRLFCTEDGTVCFPTQVQLDEYIKAQTAKLDGLETKIAEVINQVRGISGAKPAQPEEPGLVGLAKEDEFNKLSREQQQKLKGQVNKLIPHTILMGILEECSKSDDSKKCDLAGAVAKRFGAGVLAGKLSIEGKGKIMSLACTDKECRLRLEKEQGARIYKQDKRGKWHWMDEPKIEREEYLDKMRRI